MYRNISKYKVKYTDSDAFDILKPSSMHSFLEESSCLSADELGFGYEVISKKNIGFVILNSYFELFKPIRLEEELEVHTWPLKPTKATFLRDFEFYLNGKKVGVASTRWCLINVETFSILPSTALFEEGSCDWYNKERSIELNDFKIRALDEARLVYKREVRLSDYDHYFHVNNAKYADLLIDIFDEKQFEGKFVKSLLISYVKQCKIGETIEFFMQEKDGYIFVEGKVGDESRIRYRMQLADV